MTYRDYELESAPDLRNVLIDLNRERLALHLKLDRLNKRETFDLLTNTFDKNISPEFLDRIYHQTEGNPFFIEEVCKTLIEAGHISFVDGSWQAPNMAEVRIPHTVYAVIQSRLRKLPELSQKVLRMAAILGSEFDFETLKYACELDIESLINTLEQAVKVQLINEEPSQQGNNIKFAFVHVLIPTTLKQSTIHVRRRQLHLQAARAIEIVHPEDFEVLAYQYSEAGDEDRARQFYTRAGDRAQRNAPGEASRFYQAALDRMPQDTEQEEQADLLARLGYCLWVIDDIEGSLKCFRTAYTTFERVGNHTKCGEMQRMMGRMFWQQANWSLAMEHYYRALTILEKGPESFELARAVDSISQMMMLADDNENGILWGERALEIAKKLGIESTVISALNNIGSSYAQSGVYEKGNSLLQESIAQALAADLPQEANRSYYNLGVMYQRQCLYEQAQATMKELQVHANRFHAKTYSCLAILRLLWINWYTGRWDVALDIAPN